MWPLSLPSLPSPPFLPQGFQTKGPSTEKSFTFPKMGRGGRVRCRIPPRRKEKGTVSPKSCPGEAFNINFMQFKGKKKVRNSKIKKAKNGS